MTLTLEPGDMLYMPRGLVHEAATTDAAPSLHLTITADTQSASVSPFLGFMIHAATHEDRDRMSEAEGNEYDGLIDRDVYVLTKKRDGEEYVGPAAMADAENEAVMREALPVRMFTTKKDSLADQKAHASGKRQVLAALERYRSWLDNIRHPETNAVHCPDCLKLTDMMLQPKHFDHHFEMSLGYHREALEALAESRRSEPRPQEEWYGIGPEDSLELTESGKEARLSRGQLEYHANGVRQKVTLASNEAALVKLVLAGGAARVGALPSIDGFAAIAVAAKLQRLGLLTVGDGA